MGLIQQKYSHSQYPQGLLDLRDQVDLRDQQDRQVRQVRQVVMEQMGPMAQQVLPDQPAHKDLLDLLAHKDLRVLMVVLVLLDLPEQQQVLIHLRQAQDLLV